MNDMKTNQAPAQAGGDITGHDADQQLYFANALGLFHPSNEGNRGSALKLECRPARRGHNGVFFLTLMPQKEKGGRAPDGTYRRATFDWDRRICVKLDFADICAILCVLQGKSQTLGKEGKGLFHESKDATTSIYLNGPSGDFSGHHLILARKQKSGGEPSKQSFILSVQEAVCLRLLFEQGLFPVIFGYPGPKRFGNESQPEGEIVATGAPPVPEEVEAPMPF